MIFTSLVASITGKKSSRSECSTAGTETQNGGPSPFADVETEQTVSDIINQNEATNKLPAQWELKYDLRYDESDTLTEVAIVHHPSHPAQFELRAADTHEPLETTHLSIESANAENRHLTTADAFQEAYKIIREYLAKIEERTQSRQSTEDEWNNAGPARVTSQNRSPTKA